MTKKQHQLLNSERESHNTSSSDEHDGKATIIPCPENIVALDCEMVGVGDQKKSSLARCSIIDYHGNVLYDEYIRPKGTVTDYRTKWSGIRPNHMSNAIPYVVARKQILRILKNKIIVGHALDFDFRILKLRRNHHQIRDTSTFCLLREKAGLVKNKIPSLKNLSCSLLQREIQYPTHCSIEDSLAAMDLYRMVEKDWENLFSSQEIENNNKSIYFHDSFWPDQFCV